MNQENTPRQKVENSKTESNADSVAASGSRVVGASLPPPPLQLKTSAPEVIQQRRTIPEEDRVRGLTTDNLPPRLTVTLALLHTQADADLNATLLMSYSSRRGGESTLNALLRDKWLQIGGNEGVHSLVRSKWPEQVTAETEITRETRDLFAGLPPVAIDAEGARAVANALYRNDSEFRGRGPVHAVTRHSVGIMQDIDTGELPATVQQTDLRVNRPVFYRYIGGNAQNPVPVVQQISRIVAGMRGGNQETPQNIDELAIFTHGHSRGMEMGSYNERNFVRDLSPFLSRQVQVSLYACSTADESSGPSYARGIAEGLGAAGHESTVFGHTTYGVASTLHLGRTFHAAAGSSSASATDNYDLIFPPAFIESEITRLATATSLTTDQVRAVFRTTSTGWMSYRLRRIRIPTERNKEASYVLGYNRSDAILNLIRSDWQSEGESLRRVRNEHARITQPRGGRGRRRAARPATAVVQQRPAAPREYRQDRSQLRINAPARLFNLDYLSFISNLRNDGSSPAQTINVGYTSATTWDASAWTLYDAGNRVVNNLSGLFGFDYTLSAQTLKNHIDRQGPSAYGEWTLRYVKDEYYDEVYFNVDESGGPATTLTDAATTASYFNIRSVPGSGPVIGRLMGGRTPVQVTNKARVNGEIWYKIRFTSDYATTLNGNPAVLPANSEGWVISGGVSVNVPWAVFLQQLRAFETAHSSLSVSQRITRLRQLSHGSDLPFDSIIGVGAGSEYLDTRAFNHGRWDVLENSLQVVRMPDNSLVDVYHLMVGLDVLPAARRVEDDTYMLFSIGQNYAAATWSGDIGAGAADAYLGTSREWETQNGITSANRDTPANRSRIIDYYYTSRAPESDLRADLDAWGVQAVRDSNPSITSVEQLITSFYAPAPGNTLTNNRKAGIEAFYRNYGFSTGRTLSSQPSGARSTFINQIYLFAQMWIRNRSDWGPLASYDENILRLEYCIPMTVRFYLWLEQQATAAGASVP